MSAGYHAQMYGRRPDPESTRIFWWLWTTVAAIVTIFTVVFLVGDLRGGNATATVVDVSSPGSAGRPGDCCELYTVSFVTRDGTRCQSYDKSLIRAERIHVSDTFQVHYSSISPCEQIRRADESDWWEPLVVPPIFLAIGVVGLLGTRGRRFRRDRDDWFRVRRF